jgi:adenosine deaminase
MPKAELHLHLEGAVAAETFADLARKNTVPLPDHNAPASLYEYDGLVDFLKIYTLVSHSVVDRDDFRRVTYECLARCADSGARYVELFFSPESHLEVGVEYPAMLDGIIQGMHDVRSDRGVESNLVPAINRELGAQRARQFVEMVVEHRRPEVIGIGLDFNEAGFPPEDYVDAFDYAARHGLHRTSHAGEVGPAANVRNSIEVLGCERIDHGYHVVDDEDLLAACVESQIVFTACPTTTTYTTVWRDLAAPDHAIRLMADAGLNLTINSDDPPMFSIDLGDEYVTLHDVMGFRLDEIRQFALNGIGAAWVDESTKQRWHQEWSAEIDRMLVDVQSVQEER